MIEAWDFDGDAGVLRVVPASGSDAQEQLIPIASLINLSWGGVRENDLPDEYRYYEVSLFFEDGGRHGFLHLPGSADYVCAWSDQARDMARQLRTFLKPLCPRLESTTWETLVKFWKNPSEGFKSIQDRVGTRLAALDTLIPTPKLSGPGRPEELAKTPDPAAPARELLTQLQSALGQLSQVAAAQQKKRAESGGLARVFRILLVVGLAFLFGLWLIRK